MNRNPFSRLRSVNGNYASKFNYKDYRPPAKSEGIVVAGGHAIYVIRSDSNYLVFDFNDHTLQDQIVPPFNQGWATQNRVMMSRVGTFIEDDEGDGNCYAFAEGVRRLHKVKKWPPTDIINWLLNPLNKERDLLRVSGLE